MGSLLALTSIEAMVMDPDRVAPEIRTRARRSVSLLQALARSDAIGAPAAGTGRAVVADHVRIGALQGLAARGARADPEEADLIRPRARVVVVASPGRRGLAGRDAVVALRAARGGALVTNLARGARIAVKGGACDCA